MKCITPSCYLEAETTNGLCLVCALHGVKVEQIVTYTRADTTYEVPPKPHRFSGWPGAYCLDCGVEDPYEMALALGWLDITHDEYGMPNGFKFDTPEHEREVLAAVVCTVSSQELLKGMLP